MIGSDRDDGEDELSVAVDAGEKSIVVEGAAWSAVTVVVVVVAGDIVGDVEKQGR